MKKTIAKRVLLIAAIVTAIIPVCLLAWDYADPPMMWHKEAQENKRVILEYAEKHFPEAKIIKQVYESSKLNFSANPHDYILFEQDGVRFSIWANDGMFLGENFLYAKASQFIEREIILPFLNSKNHKAINDIYMPYGTPTEDITKYEEEIIVSLYPEYEPGKNSPEEVYWLYEFYVYWRSNSNLKNYRVNIEYRINNDTNKTYLIRFKEDTLFENADEFYAAFQYIESNL